MIARCTLLTVVLLLAFAARVQLTPRDTVQPEPLWKVPSELGSWQGYDLPLEAEVVAATGVDDYLNRNYRSPGALMSLYVAYYRSQRPGHAIHSPMNCMPGAGWQPVKIEPVDLGSHSDAAHTVKKVIIEKGGKRQLVLYWYQTVDRVTANEYLSKLLLMTDAFRLGRTDIALVRVVTPIDLQDPDGEANALQRALPFATRVLPVLDDQLFQS
jgi:EpsI family protein